MSATEARGIVHGRTIVLSADTPDIPEGTEVVVLIRPLRGSVSAVLAAMDDQPHLSTDIVDELEAVIASGPKRPPSRSPFEEIEHAEE